jgi:hypothetical protein
MTALLGTEVKEGLEELLKSSLMPLTGLYVAVQLTAAGVVYQNTSRSVLSVADNAPFYHKISRF